LGGWIARIFCWPEKKKSEKTPPNGLKDCRGKERLRRRKFS